MPALPRLREDLVLLKRGAGGGQFGRLVHDPLQNRFLRIDPATFAALSVWGRCDSTEALAAAVAIEIGTALPQAEIAKLIEFLDQNRLLDAPRGGWRQLAQAGPSAHSPLMRLLHGYLFWKLPLCNPDAFLQRTLPVVRPLFSTYALLLIAALGLTGLYLVSRQWEQFVSEAAGLFTLQGAMAIAATLLVVKTLHELGHAYVAAYFGCRVPSIGAAFMLGTPMLYADVTDAWRLERERDRVLIDGAGISVELIIACIATFLWSFLEPGALRTVVLLLATTSWIMSVGVNLNPFMRLDGYYILADAVGVENLQPRAFRIGAWRLREMLFGLGEPCPEDLPRRTVRWMTVYAWVTWCVRLVTYFGIALLVYAYFFKALGLALFVFEVFVFIVKPLWSEVMGWWKVRDRINSSRRAAVTFSTVGILLALFVMPWSGTVYVPAMLENVDMVRLYPPRPARVASVEVRHGQAVAAGALIARLEVPEDVHEEQAVRARLRSVSLRLNRLSADEQDRVDKLVLDGEHAALSAKLKGLEQERRRLELRAPGAGHLVELEPDLHPGRWLSPKQQVALIAGQTTSPRSIKAVGYVAEADVARVGAGTRGHFVPDDPRLKALSVVVQTVSTSGAAAIEMAELAAVNGGPIAVQPDTRQRLAPTTAQFPVTMIVENEVGSMPRSLRGMVHLNGAPESLLARTWRRFLRILLQESGA